jgi:hypothetical protein
MRYVWRMSKSPVEALREADKVLTPEQRDAVLAMGAAALPALLRMAGEEEIDESWGPIHALELLAQLGGKGVRDDRAFAIFRTMAEIEPSRAAKYLATYGDPRALPLLRKAIERIVPDYGNKRGFRGVLDCVAAYERIGGKLPDDLRERVDSMRADFDAQRS